MVEAPRRGWLRERATACAAVLLAFVLPIPCGAASPNDAPLPPLDDVLRALDRTSQLYLDNALRFTCDETIIHNMGNGRRVYRFNYIYAFTEDEGLRDHRLTRRGWSRIASGKKAPESAREVRLTEYGLPTWMSRAYNWIFIFEQARWPVYDYRLLGRELHLDRPALKIRFEPQLPHLDRINDWIGTAWVDAETYQLLRVEALRLGDYKTKLQLERDLAESRNWKSRRRAHHSFFTATTSYGIERDGIRFPSEVKLESTRFVVRGGSRPPRFFEYPGWMVRQSYDNYQLFGVETQGRIGKYFNRRR